MFPFMTARIELAGIMLSEKTQRKANTIWCHLYVESKKQKEINKLVDAEVRSVVARGSGWGLGKMDEGVQTCSYKINKSWGCNV